MTAAGLKQVKPNFNQRSKARIIYIQNKPYFYSAVTCFTSKDLNYVQLNSTIEKERKDLLKSIKSSIDLCIKIQHKGAMVSTSAFPNLPPVLECEFDSRLGLEFSGCRMWHFLKLIIRGFFQVLVSSPPS